MDMHKDAFNCSYGVTGIFSFTSVEKLVEQFQALPHYNLIPMSGQDGEPSIGIC